MEYIYILYIALLEKSLIMPQILLLYILKEIYLIIFRYSYRYKMADYGQLKESAWFYGIENIEKVKSLCWWYNMD